MNGKIEISIALVTRNRPDWLRRSLTSWRGQTLAPFEIVVSDDSDDLRQSENKDLAREFGARWVLGPGRGLYANRNSVARNCRGTHVFSADDDHEHAHDFFERCSAAVREDADAAWCMGEVSSFADIEAGWILPGELRLRGAPRPPADPASTWAWSDGASICPKKVFERGLYFYEGFRFGSSYLEFGCLLHAVGQRIRTLGDIGVVHHMQQAGRSYHLPVEEWASTYFALIMLAWVYQPSTSHRIENIAYFLRQIVWRPVDFLRSFPRALREARLRRRWYLDWLAAQSSCLALKPGS